MAKGKGKPRPSLTSIRDWVQFGTVVIAAAIATYQFYLKDVLQPRQEPTALEISAKLEKVGEKNGLTLVKATMSATNPTKRRVYIPAYWFVVRGYQFHNSRPLDTAQYKKILASSGENLLNRYRPEATGEVVAQRRIVSDGTGTAWWDPYDKTHDEAVFAVPRGKFDFLELRVLYLHTRDVEPVEKAIWQIEDDGVWTAGLRVNLAGSPPGPLDYRIDNHREWAEENGAGLNWFVTMLPLW